ncbi:MAG: ABC transporter ATP-binding protein [Bacteroidetes bacterium]|nr:ABC transporter ATP-binding protein [Bacteroidota bacterium]
MKILFQYLKKQKKTVFVALLLATINQCFSLLDPWVTGHVVDEVIIPIKTLTKDRFLQLAMFWIACSVGVSMVSRIAKNFQDYYTSVIVQRLGAQVFADGLKHSLELPYQTFEDQRSGETLSILQKVRTDSEKLITSFIGILFTSIVGIVFVMIYSLNVSWKVTIIYIIAIIFIGFISSVLSRKIKVMQKKIVVETTALAGSTTESLRNIELVKSLGLANQEINRLNNTTFKILGLELKKVKYIRSLSFLQGTTVQFVRSIMVFLLLYLIFQGNLTPGKYFTFLFYSFFLFNPLQELGNIILIHREAEVSLENFKNLIETPIEFKPTMPSVLDKLDNFEFQNVSFKHQSAKTTALENINFKVNKGETIAFVGPSGSGKTTLVKLLVGLYQPMEGKLLYDGIDGKAIDLNELREKIGFVTQDTQLFSGTIKENLLFVNPHATDEQIRDVLEKASCQKLLARADNGIDTMIGEGGVKVSGGEKQRLSIARALLRNPSLLVFDEATSSLDSITEEEITSTIKNLNTNHSTITIIIAHRLSTIMHADKIFILEHGKIIEHGKHEELLLEKGLYYAMWRQQIGERKG